MEPKVGASLWRPMEFDEDARFFDFSAFYKQVEFCDRSIRLEILEEYRNVQTASKDGDTESADVDSGEAEGQVEATASKGKGVTLEDAPAASLDEAAGKAKHESETLSEASEGIGDKATEPAAERSQEAGIDHSSRESSAGSAGKQIGVGGTLSESGEKARDDWDQLGESEKAPEPPEENEAWVEVIPVNSILLAAKSCVLRTMLSNGMRESDASAPVVMKVTPQEKEAFKELLHFIYAGNLSPHLLEPDADIRALVDLLLVGDKFEVGSLMGAVLKALSTRDRTITDSVVLALEIPDALEQHPEIKAIVTEARKLVVENLKDVDIWTESLDFLTLSQDVVSFLLQSEELEATSEEEIFQGVLVWVRKNIEGTSERQGAMRKFSPHMRFGLMRGEFLLKEVLPLAEMAPPEIQERGKSGIYFQAFSDAEKLKSVDPSTRPRTGIQDKNLQFVWNFGLDETGASRSSSSVQWIGKKWRIDMRKHNWENTHTVGLTLVSNKLSGAETVAPSRVDFSFHVLVWPAGHWQCLDGRVGHVFQKDGDGYGTADALNMSWEEAQKSSYYLGPTGQMTIRVQMREKKLLEKTEKNN